MTEHHVRGLWLIVIAFHQAGATHQNFTDLALSQSFTFPVDDDNLCLWQWRPRACDAAGSNESIVNTGGAIALYGLSKPLRLQSFQVDRVKCRSLFHWRERHSYAILCKPVGWFFFQAEDGIRYYKVTGVQTCALPI